jgi:hypothetical protein
MEKPPQTIRAELTEALEELATIALAKPGESPTATCPTEAWVQRLCELDALEALDALLDRWYQVNPNVPQVIVRVTSNLIDQLQAASSPVLRKALLRSSLAIRLRPEMWSAIQSVREVFHRLEMAAQNLIDQGAIDHQSIPGSSPAHLSGALVLASALDSRTIMAIQQEAGLSKAEWAVIDGIHQRTALVETPVAQLLRWWGAIAPDDVRAMLNQLWREPTSIVEDPEIYEWALELVRNWLGTAPGEPEQFVLDAAATPDRAVRSEWVHAIGELGGPAGISILFGIAADRQLRLEDPLLVQIAKKSLLRFLFTQRRTLESETVSDGRQWFRLAWMFNPRTRSRADLARSFLGDKFTRLAGAVQHLIRSAASDTAGVAHSSYFELEFIRLNQHVELLLLLSDLFVELPRGIQHFSEALFGLDQTWQEAMRQKVDQKIEEQLNRSVLERIRDNQSLIEWLCSLKLLDRETMLDLIGQLDLRHGQFKSLADREGAVRRVAVPYAELVFQKKLERTLQRRFRAMVRILHVDGLRVHLGAESFQRLEREFGDQMLDWYSLLVGAKNYLTKLHSRFDDANDDFLYEEDSLRREVELRQLSVLSRSLGLDAEWRALSKAWH